MLGFVFLGAGAQKWNPYAVRAAVSPAPMLPHEFGGNGELTFVVGNSGNEVMKRVADQEMTLMITLSYGVPADEDPWLRWVVPGQENSGGATIPPWEPIWRYRRRIFRQRVRVW